MVDREKVARILEHLKKSIDYLKEYKVDSPETLRKNPERFAAIKNFLYEAVEDVIDIGKHLIASLQLEKAETYTQVLERLEGAGAISTELFQESKWMIEFRRSLAHVYRGVTPEEIYQYHLRVRDFERFIFSIGKFIEQLKE